MSAMKDSRLTALRYVRMVWAESRISRNSAVCFSTGINRDVMSEDRGATDGIAAALHGASA